MKIDELNILSSENTHEEESFDYKDYMEHYFDTMQISEKQKRERIEEGGGIIEEIESNDNGKVMLITATSPATISSTSTLIDEFTLLT